MSWKYEVFRAIFVALGTIEVITNLRYLIKTDGIRLARKQHQELPKEATDKQILVKVVMMLLFGALFLTVGLYFYLGHTFSVWIALITLLLFAGYGLTEALYYRHWKTTGFAAATFALLIIYLLT